MIEITIERFAELLLAEQRLALIKDAFLTLPSYKSEETIMLLLGITLKGDADAE